MLLVSALRVSPLQSALRSLLSTLSSSEWHKALDHPEYKWLEVDQPDDAIPQPGEFLRVPFLGDDAIPKGLVRDDYPVRQDGSRYLPIFLTSSRHELLQRMRSFSHGYEYGAQDTMAPAGPQGVGKSIYCYLMASFAAVNRFPLVYLPRPSEWTRNQIPPEMSHFLIKQFVALNKHWFPLSVPYYATLLQLSQEEFGIHEFNGRNNRSYQENLFRRLKTGFEGQPKPVPPFTIVDEHNELWREGPGGEVAIVHRQPEYFRPFTDWTLSGFTAMCGSAHSKFLGSMAGGQSHVVFPLVPFSREETVSYLTSESSPDRFPGLTKEQAEKIYEEYGGTPRVLHSLRKLVYQRLQEFPEQERNFNRVLDDIKPRPEELDALFELSDRFRRYCEATIDKTPRFKDQFVETVRSSLLSDEFSAPMWGAPVLDPGLFYRDRSRLYPINKFATRLILDKYYACRSITPLSNFTGSEQGFQLEVQVMEGLMMKGVLDYSVLHGSATVQKTFNLPASLWIQAFDGINFKLMETGLKNEVKLYRPASKKFARVDFILVDYKQPKVYLLQTTIMEPSKHLSTSEAKDWEGFFGPDPKKSPDVTWSMLCKHLQLDEGMPVDYIYVTTTEETHQKTRPDWLPKNVDVCIMPKSKLNLLHVVV